MIIEKPFIIWTFRRSGGTNLGDALFHASSFQSVQHEPFNTDRVFKHVINDWNENISISALKENISEILEKNIN